MCKVPHKHAELIKAWADNPSLVFEWRSTGSDYWFDFGGDSPDWDMKELRIKPEPKPDVVEYRYLGRGLVNGGHPWLSPEDNIKAVFDGETGKLKTVELIN